MSLFKTAVHKNGIIQTYQPGDGLIKKIAVVNIIAIYAIKKSILIFFLAKEMKI